MFICNFKIASVLLWYTSGSMTSLLTHTVAHSTRPFYRPKVNNQPLEKLLCFAFSLVKVVKNGKIPTFKVNFLSLKSLESRRSGPRNSFVVVVRVNFSCAIYPEFELFHHLIISDKSRHVCRIL